MIRFHVLVNAWARTPQVEEDTLTLNRLQAFCETEGVPSRKGLRACLPPRHGVSRRAVWVSTAPGSARFAKRQRRALLVDAASCPATLWSVEANARG